MLLMTSLSLWGAYNHPGSLPVRVAETSANVRFLEAAMTLGMGIYVHSLGAVERRDKNQNTNTKPGCWG